MATIRVIERTSSGSRAVCDAGFKLILSFEGLAKRGPDGLIYAYHDCVGFPTIGVGHLLSRIKNEDLSKYPPITEEKAFEIKRQDLEKVSRSVERLLKVNVTDNQFAALVSLAFNIGTGNLQISSLLKKLNRGDGLNEVAREFLKWNKAQGIVFSGLTRRRMAESKLFLTPDAN